MPRPRHRHLWRSCPRVGLSCGRAEGSHCRSPGRVRSRDSRRPTGQRERMGRAGPQCGQPEQRGELHPPQETCTVGLKEESCLSPAGWGRWQHWFTPCWPPLLGPCCSKWSHGQHMSFVYPVLGEHLSTTPRGQSCYYPHFTATENETRRS